MGPIGEMSVIAKVKCTTSNMPEAAVASTARLPTLSTRWPDFSLNRLSFYSITGAHVDIDRNGAVNLSEKCQYAILSQDIGCLVSITFESDEKSI
jgi:hypothetical protein